MSKNNKITIYVHIPFCTSKCSYCGFFSTPYKQHRADEIISAIVTEMEQHRSLWEGRQVTSIYIGGGTPSTLSFEQFDRLFAGLRSKLSMIVGAEVSVELNPGTATDAFYALLRSCGVTRISIGIQSFSDRVLSALGRQHTAVAAVAAVHRAQRSGIRSVGIDLLYGVPGQSLDEWRATVITALELRPGHLSCYGLTLENDTPLAAQVAARTIAMPDDEAVASMYELLQRLAHEAGYEQYELSNFALPAHACRHNLHYWERGEYLGLGPSASSFVEGRRWTNVGSIGTYIDLLHQERSVIAHEELVSESQAASELLFLGLRRTAGIYLQEYVENHRLHDGSAFAEQVRVLNQAGLITINGGRLRLTARGMLLSNEVMARLIP